MKAKKKQLLMLCLALLVLAGALLFLTAQEKAETKGTDETNVEVKTDAGVENGETEAAEVLLCGMDADQIEEIHISNADGEFAFKKEQDVLTLAGFDAYEKNSDRTAELLQTICTMNGKIVESQETNWGKYGLEHPAITLHVQGQEEITLYIGDYNESAKSWYVMREGDEALYAAAKESGNALQRSPYAYLNTEFIAPFASGENVTERLGRIVIERSDLEEPMEIVASGEEAQAYTSPYEVIRPVHVKTSKKAMNEEIGSLFGFAADEAAGMYEEKDAALYGLDVPIMKMTVEHDGQKEIFTVGGQDENGLYYLISSRNDLLYKISESKLHFLHLNVNDLFFGMALLPDIETVERVELVMDGESHEFQLAREKEEIAEVTDGDVVLDQKRFRKFYSFLLELDVQEVFTEETEGTQKLKITYHYINGQKDEVEMKVLEDGRTAGIWINGKMSFKGRAAYATKLKTELEHLLSGEEIDTNW